MRGRCRGKPHRKDGRAESCNGMVRPPEQPCTAQEEKCTLVSLKPLFLRSLLLLLLSRFGHVWLCDPMDCSQPGFSVHRILQARILEWVAMLAFGGSSHPRIEPTSPAAPVLQADSLPLSHWEATGKPLVGQVFMFIETTCRSCSPGSSSLGPLWGQSLPFWPAQVMLMHHNRQSKPQYCKI